MEALCDFQVGRYDEQAFYIWKLDNITTQPYLK